MHHFLGKKHKKKGSNIVTDEELEECYHIMARIIRDHGDVYLPIFKRLHEERELRRKNNDLKSIALRIADELKK
jgi:hypothetical protein